MANTNRGFSLIEALVALSVTSLAGAVLLLGVESSLSTTTDAVEQTIADGIAQQMLHEILTKRYAGPGENPLAATLGPTSAEALAARQNLFDDVDDYEGYVAKPLKGIDGERLGVGDGAGGQRLANFRVRSEFFSSWRLRVNVYYVDPNNHTVRSNAPTYFRAVEVNVEHVQPSGAALPLASRKRIVAYIPPPP
jgi:prepilin-type N-terminal cleavage/methylation domain-containing protein